MVTEAEIAHVPPAAQRYLRCMGIIGRPRDTSFRLGWSGLFRTGLQRPWAACDAWQYNASSEIARVFWMRLRMGGLPVMARDTYLRGHGRMHVRMLDLVSMVDAHGPELDAGELVTWLDDAVGFAPSMLLGSAITWSEAGEHAFDLAVTDAGRTVSGRVTVDDRGRPIEFETTDRYCEDPSDPKQLIRARWTTPFGCWETVEGRVVPMFGRAIWHIDGREYPYAEFRVVPGSLVYNVSPGD